MTDYKPGDVATLTIADQDVRAILTETAIGLVWQIAGHQFYESISFGNGTLITDVRPLVVLDLADITSNPAQLVRHLRSSICAEPHAGAACVGAAMVADQIEAQTRPPKPAEPTGLGAVVEDAEGVHFVRVQTHYPAPWVRQGVIHDGSLYKYGEIDAVRIVGEGVTL